MLSITPLLAWFFTLVLLLLAARATACLVVSRPARRTRPARSDRLRDIDRNREFGHAAMALGMAALLEPGIPRPPSVVSVTFFAALAAWAAFDWFQRLLARIRGRTVKSCTGAGAGGPHLLDPHHAIVSAAMVVMLLRPGMGSASASASVHAPGAAAAGSAMPGMTMDVAPSTPTLLLLGYVWIAALVLGVGMTRVLAVAAVPAAPVGSPGPSRPRASHSQAVLSSPATVYACELAMTVLTGLMLVT